MYNKYMLTKQELKNILALLNRVEIKGTEAITLAQLQVKILGIHEKMPDEVKEQDTK